MQNIIEFIVPGEPVAKGRPRFTSRGHVYTPEKTSTYEREVAILGSIEMAGKNPISGPVMIELEATFSIPKSWSVVEKRSASRGEKSHIGRPDADNLLKIVGDALNKIVWLDDSQIVSAKVFKTYGEYPSMKIRIYVN